MRYIVRADVGGASYITNINADSCASAEHLILSQAICTSRGYGVDACQAYTMDDICQDYCWSALRNSDMVSLSELGKIIRGRNKALMAADKLRRLERRRKRLDQQITELTAQLDNDMI